MPHMFTNRPRIHDLTKDWSDIRAQFRWETINAVVYKFGGLTFVIGSVLFFPVTLQLMNLTAVSFVVGSVLFTVASIPCLWKVPNPSFKTTLYAFLAWQYLIGSILFLLGSVFNYWRAYIVTRDAIRGQKESNAAFRSTA
jgi:hypothetical protein